MFRESLADSLASAGMSVVAVGDARAGTAAIRSHRPDVVVMDLALAGISGIAATRDLIREDFKPPILMLTATEEPALVFEAFRAGVLSYALKTQAVADLIVALHQTAKGQRYLAPSLASKMDPGHLPDEGSAGAIGVTSVLTQRELEIFDLVVAGHATTSIARLLFISVKTVETHRSRINKKLGVHSTADMIRLAARCGRLLL
jgi:two-component system response regulator NreC